MLYRTIGNPIGSTEVNQQMRHINSEEITDFSAIYDEDVEMISVSRPRSSELEELASRLFYSRSVIETQWTQGVDNSDAPQDALRAYIDDQHLAKLCEEITLGAEIVGELLGAKQVGVRVGTLNSPMCPRFHADQVPCRMLMTVSGPGTEWIPNDDVDKAVLADRENQEPPVRHDGKIRQLLQGSWSLLKGGTWQEDFHGVVHRSPHQEGQRLLISLDPVFTG